MPTSAAGKSGPKFSEGGADPGKAASRLVRPLDREPVGRHAPAGSLPPEGRRYWRRIVAQAGEGFLTRADTDALVILCRTLVEIDGVAELIDGAEFGRFEKDDEGRLRVSPVALEEDRLVRRARQLMKDLGIVVGVPRRKGAGVVAESSFPAAGGPGLRLLAGS